MEYKGLLLTKEDGLGIVTINQRKVLNVRNNEFSIELYEMFTALEKDPEIRVIILTGVGKSFIAGADILELKDQDSVQIETCLVMARRARDRIFSCKQPVIAAINGLCLGGGLEIALCCDLRIASESALFGLPEINLGIIPGGGGITSLIRLVGMTRAKEMIFTGDTYDSKAALEIGFINKVVPPDKLMDEAKAMAAKLLAKSSVALNYAKKSCNSGVDMSMAAGIDMDENYFCRCFATEDQKEGMKAFVEKRKPHFLNR